MTTENSQNYSFSIEDDCPGVKMVVLGAGGMGNNAMENLARAGIADLELYSLNTDVQALRRCRGSKPIQLGSKRTKGKGAGGDSEMGRLSAEDDAENIRKIVCGAELVFIAAGMGGGTGTGSAPVIARICREVGVLSVCVVTMPMNCEGPKRMAKACVGLEEIRKYVDSILIIENENLSKVMVQEDISIIDVFRRADKVVVDAVSAVTRIINSHGYINLDFADLKKVLQRGVNDTSFDAFIGFGEASGGNRAIQAAEMALRNPLMREVSIYGAANLLVNVIGSDQMGHKEAMSAIKSVVEMAGDLDREIFMGVVPDNSMGDKLSITVIATGLPNHRNSKVTPLSGRDSRALGESVHRIEEMNVSNVRIAGDPELVEKKKTIIGTESDYTDDVEFGRKKNMSAVNDIGYSPLIQKEDWKIPAYLRANGKSVEIINPVAEIRAISKSGDCRILAENYSHTNHCREALFNMAS